MEFPQWKQDSPQQTFSEKRGTGKYQQLTNTNNRRTDIGPVSTRDNRVLKGPLGRSLRSFARTAHSAHSAHSLRRAPLGYICLNLFGYAELD